MKKTNVNPKPKPKLLFIILDYNNPLLLSELAQVLVKAGTDATVMLHFDSRSPAEKFEVLHERVADEARIRLVERRVATRWGSWGLVEAPLNALAQAEAEGIDPDYVILLSGSCLPCRPIAELERFLTENAGKEFIEAEDESWVGNGWRSERWRYRFWFDHKTQRPAEWAFYHLQRILRLKREFPQGMEPRFGSQWWALTWETCRALLSETRRSPKRLEFFRSVWIPDEMALQSYVYHLVPSPKIAGHSLTHFQFTDRGRPIVYHDDHLSYTSKLEKFFVRKVSPSAKQLRGQLLEQALQPDRGDSLKIRNSDRHDYRRKTNAQTHYPVAGQIFFRDQRNDSMDSVLALARSPYIVLVGPPALTGQLTSRIDHHDFTVLGEVFHSDAVLLGPDASGLKGLDRNDKAIRDLHPALYLARIRERCEDIPVIPWSPLYSPQLLKAVLRDPKALIVGLLPCVGDATVERDLLAWSCLSHHPSGHVPGMEPKIADRVLLDEMQRPFGHGTLDRIGSLIWQEQGATCHDRFIALPWSLSDAERTLNLRQVQFERTMKCCRYSVQTWLEGLQLQAFWDGVLRDDALKHFQPLSENAKRILAMIGAEKKRSGPMDGQCHLEEHTGVSNGQALRRVL